jgi:hypothetical protein
MLVKGGGSMSLPPLVNLPLSDAPPIGSPSPDDLKRMTKGIKKDADVLGMIDELKRNYEQGDWILASAGGSTKVKGKTKKQWLEELHDTWNKEKRIKRRAFLYVAFQIWTPVPRAALWKAEGVELLKALDAYGITYGVVGVSSNGILFPTDPDDLFSR